jgi:DNA-binding transcriptional LysR family regulator
MLDSKRLRIFCAVADDGSFTAAATRLHLTQSAVSQQIALLERDLDVLLMERMPRGIRLTEAGKVLNERARKLIRESTELERDLRLLVDRPKTLTLGVFSTANAYLAPLVVKRFRQLNLGYQLALRAVEPSDLASELVYGTIDVGLTWDYDFLRRSLPRLQTRHLLTDPLCLLVPADHPLAAASDPVRLADLADESWVVRHHSAAPYEEAFEVMCRSVGFEPRVVFRTDDYQSAQGLVAAGVGVAVAPRLSTTIQHPDIAIKPIVDPSFTRRIESVVLSDALNASQRDLLELIADVCTRDIQGRLQTGAP